MHGALKRNNISAVTAGTRLFADRLDLRTPRGRRFKDLIASYSSAVGKPTTAQVAIIRDLSMMQVISEDLQMVFLDTGKLDNVQHSRVVNMMRRHMQSLGLIRGAANAKTADEDGDADELDPLEYVKRGRKRSRFTDNNGEDE